MKEEAKLGTIDRRGLMLTGAAAAALGALLGSSGIALAQDNFAQWQVRLKKIVGEAKPVESGIKLDVPEIAENGNTVPFAVSVDSPMTDADYVKAIHLISTGNPVPDIASYRFSPGAGQANIASRMRLAKTQDIIAVAELSNGKFLLGKRTVKVTIGGCGG
jgi:sulfur-oxidizing protein SoxY